MAEFISSVLGVAILALIGGLVGLGVTYIGLPLWAAITSGILAAGFVVYTIAFNGKK